MTETAFSIDELEELYVLFKVSGGKKVKLWPTWVNPLLTNGLCAPVADET